MITQFCPDCGTILFYNENDEEGTKCLYVFCNNCGHNSKSNISLIQTKNYKKSSTLTSLKNRKFYIYDNTFPRTIYYDCPNSSCKTHEEINKKEAIFFNEKKSLKQTYICTECLTEWRY